MIADLFSESAQRLTALSLGLNVHNASTYAFDLKLAFKEVLTLSLGCGYEMDYIANIKGSGGESTGDVTKVETKVEEKKEEEEEIALGGGLFGGDDDEW